MADIPAEGKQSERRRDRIPAISATMCLIWSVVFWQKPDMLAALTIWPFWVIAGLALLPGVVALRKERVKSRLAILAMWLVAWVLIGDEALPLVRTLTPLPNVPSLRVVTLNAAGLSEAASEVVQVRPDVVLVQESMGQPSLETLRRKLGNDWSLLTGIDTSILVRGDIVAVALPSHTLNFIAGWASLTERTLIVSIRLRPPVFRLDYWNPSCWRAYAENKRARRRELQMIADFVFAEAKGAPIIFGGDFNIPPDHTVTDSLQPDLSDSFKASGRGWGATAVNDYPMVRIDQVWASKHFEPVTVSAKKTRHSDHQMVVADIVRPEAK